MDTDLNDRVDQSDTNEPYLVSCARCDGSGYLPCQECIELDDEYIPSYCEHEDNDIRCPNCNGTGQVADPIYVNVYAVTRHWGGPEEGGWWYDAGEAIGSMRATQESIPALLKIARESYASMNEGDIGSVLGGVRIDVCIEGMPAENWPARRPRYE